jgi:hypothetical protein
MAAEWKRIWDRSVSKSTSVGGGNFPDKTSPIETLGAGAFAGRSTMGAPS